MVLDARNNITTKSYFGNCQPVLSLKLVRKIVTIPQHGEFTFAADPNFSTMNFSFDFYQRMKADLSEKAYLKAFEMAKYMEMHPRSEWADIVHRGCSHREWAEGCGAAVEHWFNSNLLWQ